MTLDLKKSVTRIRAGKEIMTRQKIPYFTGISRESAGAQGISMNLVIIPAGAKAEPHYHKDFETAIYILEGRVENRYGENLKESIVTEKGDFLFIPPGVPHQPVNLSATEPAVAIVSRNDPNEMENVVMYEVEEE
ncbi:MAG: cupin domain-containing protein [Nitrospinae bacterium]|jgi:uncharacterized RmlC-like cupin family protein|nr:cupin domain-containing protein [Nitrospinota bacterium]MDA1110254.1 cupin domain-containing protein [Nitrospinota bacterium]